MYRVRNSVWNHRITGLRLKAVISCAGLRPLGRQNLYHCYIETGCSTSCGDGFRLLVPQSQAVGCGQLVLQVLPCNERNCPVDCSWDHWTAWSQCAQRVKRQAGYGSPSLDGANTVCSQSRARVIRKAPLNGGRQCRGESIEERYCTSADCTGRLLHVDNAQEQIV